jgi:hypothetical protein
MHEFQRGHAIGGFFTMTFHSGGEIISIVNFRFSGLS